MFAVYGSKIKEIDSLASKRYLIPNIVLMENAAIASCNAIVSKWRFSSACVICGRGNNGGDGFGIARHLFNRGVKVTVVIIGDKRPFSAEARQNLRIVQKLGIAINENPSRAVFKRILESSEILVDAVYGTGFRGKLSPSVRKYFKAVNSSGKRVASLDIPSGVDADNGYFDDDCIKPDLTVTFGAVKTGLLWNKASAISGELLIADISIPQEAILSAGGFPIAEKELLSAMVSEEKEKREAWAHKSRKGSAAFIGGKDGMEGSIQMAAKAAMSAGAGITYLFSMSSAKKRFFPEIVFSESAAEAIKKSSAVVAGCGMGTDDESAKVLEIIKNESREKNVVYDADALNIISKFEERRKKEYLRGAVVTPHPEEFFRLSRRRFFDIAEKIRAAEEFSKHYGCLLVLKSPPTIITDSKTTMIFPNMSRKLATAGSGDVLAGIIGGFISQGYSPFASAATGVYVHFKSGEACKADSPSATDFIRNISKAKREVFNA